MAEINPIRAVGSNTTLPAPAKYIYNAQDVSAPDAGRTEDVKMQKKRIGLVPAFDLGWNALTLAEISAVLKAFVQNEYFQFDHLDPMVGGFVTEEFYVGDRSAPLYNSTLDFWENVEFTVIRRDGKKIL